MSGLAFPVPDELVEAIVARVAELLGDALHEEHHRSPYFTVAEAAEYLRCEKQHVYDLRSDGRLSRCTEGGRALVLRAECFQLVDTQAATPLAVRASTPSR
jgi:excisionase family DNA binding protein